MLRQQIRTLSTFISREEGERKWGRGTTEVEG
jgi:hypothetical protein